MEKSNLVSRPPPRIAARAPAIPPIITSRSNNTIKTIRSLRQRKYREQSGRCFVDGVPLVTEAIRQCAEIELLVFAPELLRKSHAEELIETCRQRGAAMLEVTTDVWNSLPLKENTRGIGAIVRQRWESLKSIHLGSRLCWVVLDSTEFPGNLGTILRTSDAVGGAGVILLGHTTDPYDPASVSASRGAIFSQRLVRTTFAEFARWKMQCGHITVGTSPYASQDYRASAYSPPLLLFMGSEQHGLSAEQQSLCDVTVRIPMVGLCDSLNLGVATSIMLYEIFRHHRAAAVRGIEEKVLAYEDGCSSIISNRSFTGIVQPGRAGSAAATSPR